MIRILTNVLLSIFDYTLELCYSVVSGDQCPIRIITDPAFYRNAPSGLLGPASVSCMGLAPSTICVSTILPPPLATLHLPSPGYWVHLIMLRWTTDHPIIRTHVKTAIENCTIYIERIENYTVSTELL